MFICGSKTGDKSLQKTLSEVSNDFIRYKKETAIKLERLRFLENEIKTIQTQMIKLQDDNEKLNTINTQLKEYIALLADD